MDNKPLKYKVGDVLEYTNNDGRYFKIKVIGVFPDNYETYQVKVLEGAHGSTGDTWGKTKRSMNKYELISEFNSHKQKLKV